MHPSIRTLSSRAHQPLIKFIGKRTYPRTRDTPQAHPAAPADVKTRFFAFLKKVEHSYGSHEGGPPASSSNNVLNEFWEAPERLWKRDIEQAEIDAILSGGASVH